MSGGTEHIWRECLDSSQQVRTRFATEAKKMATSATRVCKKAFHARIIRRFGLC